MYKAAHQKVCDSIKNTPQKRNKPQIYNIPTCAIYKCIWNGTQTPKHNNQKGIPFNQPLMSRALLDGNK